MAPTRTFPLRRRSFKYSESTSSANSSINSNPLFQEDDSKNTVDNFRLQSDFTTNTDGIENSTVMRRRTATRRSYPQASCLTGTPTHSPVYETDPITLVRRQKQIDYGKNTEEYKKYVTEVPREKRTPRSLKTPDRYQKCSRRSWDGQIKVWRLCLHAWATSGSEPSSEQAEKDEPNASFETNSHS